MSKSVNLYEKKDKQLFAEVQKLMDGNFESYQNIYELSKNYIYKVIYDIVQDHHTTEDMMQETYLQVYNKINSLREAQAFYVWAGRIASNLTLRYLQKYRREILVEATDDDGEEFIFDTMVNDNEAFIPESVLENEEQQRIIAGILESLSPEQKLTVQYFYYEEMSVNDIAALMECSAGTVKSRLNYARKSLKTAVSQFETDNNVKLYSLSGLPIFFLVFKDLSEAMALGAGVAGAAAVAGGVIGGGAATTGGTLGGSAAVAGGTAIGETVAAASGGTVATTGAAGVVSGGAVAATGAAGVASGGTVAAAGAAGSASVAAGGGTIAAAGTAGTAGGAGATAGFLGTVAGKVAVAAAVAVVGGAAVVAVTQTLGNGDSAVESNAVKQEFVDPWTIIYSSQEDILENLDVEPGSNLDSRAKDSWYDKDGNLLVYQVVEMAVIQVCGETHCVSSKYYYPDGTLWYTQEYSNYSYSDYPQYGWYGVETYTENVMAYYSDGTVFTNCSYEFAQGYEISCTYYDNDGLVRSYAEYEYAELDNGRWERVKGSRYDADGSLIAYNTFEYDENGELIRDNFYNADGELQYYHIRVHDENGTREEGYNADGTPLH